MNWTKIAFVCLFLVIIFTVGAFATHFGYRVHGVPHGMRPSFHTIELVAPGESVGIDTQYIVHFDDGTNTQMSLKELYSMIDSNGIVDIVGFLTSLGSFSVDGMPYEVSLIFDILVLLMIYLLASTFIPFIPG